MLVWQDGRTEGKREKGLKKKEKEGKRKTRIN